MIQWELYQWFNWPTIRASGVTFNLCAACEVITTTAPAASFSVLALPAVTVPTYIHIYNQYTLLTVKSLPIVMCSSWPWCRWRGEIMHGYEAFTLLVLSPVSIQTQSLALRALRKRKPQETQALALASNQSWLPLLRPSIPMLALAFVAW